MIPQAAQRILSESDPSLHPSLAADPRWIVTHKADDFRGAKVFGVTIVNPKEFLKQLDSQP